MRDMNDFYVGNNCSTRVHYNGYVFTVDELVALAINSLSKQALEEHREQNN